MLSLDIFFKDQKIDHLLDSESVLKTENQNEVCKQYSRHVFINQMFTLNEITSSLKQLIPQLDDYMTCRNSTYLKKTDDFFKNDFVSPQVWKVDTNNEGFIKMGEQINRMESN